MPTEYETYASMACQAVPQDKLLGQLMDSTFYKTDREHAAVREILRLQGEVEGADVLHEVEKRMHAETRRALTAEIERAVLAERRACHDLALINGKDAPTQDERDMAQSIARTIAARGIPECTCAAKDMPFGRCCKADTYADANAGLQMAIAQAAAMIERQQHVMQRAMDAWDTTTHQKNGDGRLWQCMEELRGECAKQPNVI